MSSYNVFQSFPLMTMFTNRAFSTAVWLRGLQKHGTNHSFKNVYFGGKRPIYSSSTSVPPGSHIIVNCKRSLSQASKLMLNTPAACIKCQAVRDFHATLCHWNSSSTDGEEKKPKKPKTQHVYHLVDEEWAQYAVDILSEHFKVNSDKNVFLVNNAGKI